MQPEMPQAPAAVGCLAGRCAQARHPPDLHPARSELVIVGAARRAMGDQRRHRSSAPGQNGPEPSRRRCRRKGPRKRTRSPNVLHVIRRWAASRRGIRWTLGGIAAVGLAPAAARVLFVPAGDRHAHHDRSAQPGNHFSGRHGTPRGRLLTAGAGLLATGGVLFTVRKFVLSRDGQVTDRYAKAIEQLGSEKLDVRIGGICALERVARDSATDHPAVMEMLAAFIREHSHEQRPPPGPSGRARERSLRPDVQAALTVVGRRLTERDIEPIDLARADLTGANLGGARLTGANLDGSYLTGAELTKAGLANAVLARADLRATKLVRADLTGANLSGARLTCADLTGANLTSADLADADLTRADLTRAELTGARWPIGGPVPVGWKPHTGSGQLIPAGTGAETAQANQPHG